MSKTLMYRWFGLGAIPKAARPLVESEGVVVAEEGIPGWFLARKVNGPRRRFRRRRAGFSGSLVVTSKRILSFAYSKPQINISVDDPKTSGMFVEIREPDWLSLLFESSLFSDDWSGEIEYRFRTDKARQFQEALTNAGVRLRS